MELYNIVNRESVNITNCDHEPIHIPGSIQPHGYLLGVDAATNNVTYCSENIEGLLNKPMQQVLGQPLSSFLTADDYRSYLNHIGGKVFDYSRPCMLTVSSKKYNVSIHATGGKLVLEFEAAPLLGMDVSELYDQTKDFVKLIESSKGMKELCQAMAVETRHITGYDRVMVYRFDKDYNGEVYAESLRDDLLPFLGHHYPHTDIPKQARELYLRNLMRMIVDVDYTPVPIYTNSRDATAQNLDLSVSNLRSVSPIHCEYLRNMGVKATLVISLIQDKKLWGMISCHHYSVKNIPHYTRLFALLQGQFMTSQIKVRETEEEFELTKDVEQCLNTIKKHIVHNERFLEDVIQDHCLLKMVNAGGVVIKHHGRIYTAGEVPAQNELAGLLDWLQANYNSRYLATDNLSELYTPAKEMSQAAAGILYYPMQSGDGILWVRPELEKHIYWAGEPAKGIMQDTSTGRLSPRTSFELWKEEVRNQSAEWRTPEIVGASELMNSLQRQFSIISITTEEEKYRKLSGQLLEVNRELANFNWISTHDLKEPLRKIQIFSSRILKSDTDSIPAMVLDSVSRMNRSAGQMQQYIEDILAYSNEKDGGIVEPVNLNDVLQELAQHYSEETEKGNLILKIDDMPTISGIKSELERVFYNLAGNALKFAKEGEAAEISVSCKTVNIQNDMAGADKGEYYQITFADKGIGFESEYNRNIFDVFKRLHTKDAYEGTGIGLSICRKIMRHHNGYITANGVEGQGATFDLYFPV